jgi:hypothetical protein
VTGTRRVRTWESNGDLKTCRRGVRQLLKIQRSANATKARDLGTLQRERAGLRVVTRNNKSTYEGAFMFASRKELIDTLGADSHVENHQAVM